LTKFTYDAESEAYYLKLTNATIRRSQTLMSGATVIVDYDAEGDIVGIEVL